MAIPDSLAVGSHRFVVVVNPKGGTPSPASLSVTIGPAAVIATASAPETPTTVTTVETPPVAHVLRIHNIQEDPTDVQLKTHALPVDGLGTPTNFGSSLTPIWGLEVTPATLLTSAGIAGLFLLLVAFPAELLEATIRENYSKAFGWMEPVRKRVSPITSRYSRFFKHRWVASLTLVVIAAFLLGFSNPEFGLNPQSFRVFIGLTISLVVLNVGIGSLVSFISRRRFGIGELLVPMPAGLIIVILSVVLSRLAGISPGFLFGLVVGMVYVHKLGTKRRALLFLMLIGITMAVGLLAWVGYSILQGQEGEGFWHELGKETMVALTLEALSTLVIALLPFHFLDGRIVYKWSKVVWGLTYAVAVMVFVIVVLPVSNNWGEVTAPIFGWGTLFAVFAAISVGTWLIFRFVPGCARLRRRATRTRTTSPRAPSARSARISPGSSRPSGWCRAVRPVRRLCTGPRTRPRPRHPAHGRRDRSRRAG